MKPTTPRAARLAEGLSVEKLCSLVPCAMSTWWAAERAEKWPAHPALRLAAMDRLRCAERNGKVYRKVKAAAK